MTDPACGLCNNQAERPGQGVVLDCPVRPWGPDHDPFQGDTGPR